MEVVENKALSSFRGTALNHWFRNLDDTWLKIKIQVEAFIKHINSVDRNKRFTREAPRLPFLDCAVVIVEYGSLDFENLLLNADQEKKRNTHTSREILKRVVIQT